MFMQFTNQHFAFTGVRNYLGNVGVAVHGLVGALFGHQCRSVQSVSVQPGKNIFQPPSVKRTLSDEKRLYLMMRGADSVNSAIASELNAIAARNRLS